MAVSYQIKDFVYTQEGLVSMVLDVVGWRGAVNSRGLCVHSRYTLINRAGPVKLVIYEFNFFFRRPYTLITIIMNGVIK